MKKYTTKSTDSKKVEEPLSLYLTDIFSTSMFDSSPSKIRDFINKGVGFNFLNKLQLHLGFSEEKWADILSLSPKSLQRYRKEKDFKFKPIHSEKLVEIAEVVDAGLEVFGDNDKLYLWLSTPNFALGNQKPMDLISDSYGKQMVLEELVRIEHGIFV